MASKLQLMREELAKASKVKMIKPRKKRKMTDEQKAVLVDRMAKARAARGPAKNLSVHEDIRNLADDHPLNPNKIKEWIKEQKLLLHSLRGAKDSKDPAQRSQYWETETYVTNLQRYLQDGIYRDSRYGSERQHRSRAKCVAMAYYPDGTPKRTPGIYYSDIGGEYTNEMAAEDYARARQTISNKKRIRKTN